MKNCRILILSALLISNTAFEAPKLIDKIAVIVNHDIILQSEIDNLVNIIKLQSQKTENKIIDENNLRTEIIDNKIMENMILQLNKTTNLQITQDQLNAVIRNIAKENNLNYYDLYRNITQNRKLYNEFYQNIRKRILIEEVRNNAIRSRINFIPQEIETAAKQISVQNAQENEFDIRQILIPVPENATYEQLIKYRKLANQIVKQLKMGADFNKISSIQTDISIQTKQKNKKWSKVKELPSIFAESLSIAKKGDVIGPIKSGIGYHILKVKDCHFNAQPTLTTQARISHILLKTSPIFNDNQARIKLKEIISRIQSGKTTFDIAKKEFSEDYNSITQLNEGIWISIENDNSLINNILLKMKKGQISQPIHLNEGWSIIKLLDIQKVDKNNEINKQLAYRVLLNKKIVDESKKWIEELREITYIKIL